MSTRVAMLKLERALATDQDYLRAWCANLSQTMIDSGIDREASQEATRRFLNLTFNIEPEAINAAMDWAEFSEVEPAQPLDYVPADAGAPELTTEQLRAALESDPHPDIQTC